MTAVLLDGLLLSKKMKEKIKAEVADLKSGGIESALATVLVGEDPASKVYVRLKEKDCQDVGIISKRFDLPSNTSERQLLDLINILNRDETVHGILVQTPLPSKDIEKKVYRTVSPDKDVDCFHPYNLGLIALGDYSYGTNLLPCTPKGIIRLLDEYSIPVEGKLATVFGRSIRVGGTLSKMLEDRNATVIKCHSKTPKDYLQRLSKSADIVVSAVGKRFDPYNPFVVTGDFVKQGAVVIDVGNNYRGDKVFGDVDESVREIASYFTPVPGGIGPMTRIELLENTLIAVKRQTRFYHQPS